MLRAQLTAYKAVGAMSKAAALTLRGHPSRPFRASCRRITASMHRVYRAKGDEDGHPNLYER